MITDPKGRRVLQEGGQGGGYLACDGAGHFMVVPEFETIQCLEETPVGPCPGAGKCKPQKMRPAVRGDALGK
jgi:hypothetical protein